MATKSITIKENAYNLLKSMKNENDSFSDVIERIGSRRSLRDLTEIVSEEEAEEIEEEVNKARKEIEEEIEQNSREVEETLG